MLLYVIITITSNHSGKKQQQQHKSTESFIFRIFLSAVSFCVVGGLFNRFPGMIYHCRSLEIPPLKNQTRPATFHSISNTSYCSQRPITIRCLIVRPAFHCSSIDFQFSKYRSPKRGPVSETLSFAIFFLPYCNHYLFLSV